MQLFPSLPVQQWPFQSKSKSLASTCSVLHWTCDLRGTHPIPPAFHFRQPWKAQQKLRQASPNQRSCKSLWLSSQEKKPLCRPCKLCISKWSKWSILKQDHSQRECGSWNSRIYEKPGKRSLGDKSYYIWLLLLLQTIAALLGLREQLWVVTWDSCHPIESNGF